MVFLGIIGITLIIIGAIALMSDEDPKPKRRSKGSRSTTYPGYTPSRTPKAKSHYKGINYGTLTEYDY